MVWYDNEGQWYEADDGSHEDDVITSNRVYKITICVSENTCLKLTDWAFTLVHVDVGFRACASIQAGVTVTFIDLILTHAPFIARGTAALLA